MSTIKLNQRMNTVPPSTVPFLCVLLVMLLLQSMVSTSLAFSVGTTTMNSRTTTTTTATNTLIPSTTATSLYANGSTTTSLTTASTDDNQDTDSNMNNKQEPGKVSRPSEGMEITHVEPEDAIIHIAPKAMIRLKELQQQSGKEIVLRMGVRNGGCSGLSYVMDFSSREAIQEDDAVDEYPQENIVCVVDAKSMLYLYGLELDYSDALIGGGFKFFNPNAEESCGCGSSFGV